ncbi:MAG: GNAT family N-acetyltransferase [Rhodospirillales bacterium]
MPALRDPAAIRSILVSEPQWSVYALGDLAPGFFERSEWFRPPNGPGLALLFRGFETPVLFTMGAPGAVAAMLDEIGGETPFYLHVRPEIVPVIAARQRIVELAEMCRMVLDWKAYRPAPPCDGLARLSSADLEDLERLYADGLAAGETPHFFYPAMLDEGVFYGVREGRELIAAAGTHLVVPAEGVAAVGNVYTRRDRRGRGLAARTTSAVVNELAGLTVALNVGIRNEAAIRVYERLGFRRYCNYFEGITAPASAPGPR